MPLKRLKSFRVFLYFLIIGLFLFLIISLFTLFLRQESKTFANFLSNFFLIFSSFNIFIFIIAIVGIFISIGVVHSLEKISRFSQQIREGNFKASLEVKRADEIGRLAENLVQMRDQLVKILNSLEREKEKALSIIKNISDGIVVLNNQGIIKIANSVAQEILSETEKNIIGRKYYEVLKLFDKEKEKYICESNDTDCFIKKAIKNCEKINIPKNIYIIDKYERKKEISGRISTFEEKNGLSSFILAFRDVTAEKEIERMKSEFISITSHQLRTPLSSVRWYTEMLLAGDAGKLNKNQTIFLTDVHQSTITAIDLINNLLDLSRLEGGEIKYNLEPIQLETIIENLISDLSAYAKATNVEIEKTFKQIITPKVKVDSKKVYQVFSNIIVNAVNYSQIPGKRKVVLSLKKLGKEIVFSCADSGIGIPKEEQKNIFKKFFRATNTAGVGAPGSGIGLYIAKIFVEQMKGKIWFESEDKGKGTTFYVSFPSLA